MLSPSDLKRQLPLLPRHKETIDGFRSSAKDIVSGKDPRIALIAGPCSIHDVTAALDYADHFKKLMASVDKNFFLVMRVYLEKPRSARGWKGFIYDPHLDGTNDLEKGLYMSRELLLSLLEMGIPAATEFLNPLITPYIEDLITWGFIGARTSSSQPHRQLASSLSMPVGFKNSVDGNIDCAIQGVMAGVEGHLHLHIDADGRIAKTESPGNPFSHVVLRGSLDGTNYDEKSVAATIKKLEHYDLPSKIAIDCSHGNCGKQFTRQSDAFYSVFEQISAGNRNICAVMLESHLSSGNQLLLESPSSLKYGLSITDPCIGWSSTEELISWADSLLSSSVPI